ncbi:response regulator [Caulobacter sp. KR2-114]|uniref:response regulator n=1 Tax=Caulobacter sp. KR2-114 TaxID=3400912 RepID=UPI003BFEEA1E
MGRPRIVVADDSEPILELVVTRLELAGYQTFAARTGLQAMRTITEVQPQGVILDINMPGMDGFAVLMALKAASRTREIPVLMLTGSNAQADVRRALSCGARDYLAKPFDDQLLLTRVARLLRSRPVTSAPVLLT